MNRALFFLLFLLTTTFCVAQTEVENFVIRQGFENVRHISNNGKEYFFLESRAFSSYERLLTKVRNSLDSLNHTLSNSSIEVILLNKRIPYIHMQSNRSLTDNNGKLIWRSDFQVLDQYKVLRNSDVKKRFFNSSAGKVDLLFYPQFRFKNTSLDRIYLFQININPTLEIELWKGANLTAQVIIPLVNDYSDEESKIRPGFVTFSQDLRLPGNFLLRATIGNFNQFRAGADLKILKPMGKNLGIYGQVGITAMSVLLFDKWYYTELNKITWRAGMNYFVKPWNLMFNGNVGRYLGNDLSVRGEVVRFFKNASVGFYVQTIDIEDHPLNGGFFFSIALPPYVHKRSKRIRISPAKYFNFEYLARPYNNEGRIYQTSPDESSTENFFNINRLNQIINN